jgi:hypothetical protein
LKVRFPELLDGVEATLNSRWIRVDVVLSEKAR